MKKLRVYGWQGFRHECPPAPNGSKQTREIVAARSMKEVARFAEQTGPWKLFNLGETGNLHEIETAMKSPGTIFWRPIDCCGEKPKFHSTESKP